MAEMKILVLSLLLRLCAQIYAWKMPDNMAGHRRFVDGYGLGPAPFPDFKDMDFELFGDAFLQDDSVKVTDAVQHQKGAIWSKKTYNTKTTEDFQIDLTFRVGGVDNKLFGDGFALWFVAKKYRGVGGNSLGGPNKWEGMGIFFDTFNNPQIKKKHPYIYGYINDGSKDFESIITQDVENQGCHVPLRSLEEGVLEATNARVTYRNKRLTVLLQPYNADDWLQCFKIEDVVLPEVGHFGVTAMTGEVVDKHSMIGVKVYNMITVDPYLLAIDFKPSQMPKLWEEMKHSGDIAREFEEWEKDIEDEVDEFRLADQFKDYYYGAAAADNYVTSDDYYGGEGEESGTETIKKFEKPSYKNNYRKDKVASGKKSDVQLSSNEVDKIDDMISGTLIAQEIKTLNEQRRKRIRKLRKHMEAEFGDAVEQVNDLVKSVRKKEFELSRRIDMLGRRLNLKLKRAFKEQEKQSSGWFWPFFFVFVFVVVGTGMGFGTYRQHMKSHLL